MFVFCSVITLLFSRASRQSTPRWNQLLAPWWQRETDWGTPSTCRPHNQGRSWAWKPPTPQWVSPWLNNHCSAWLHHRSPPITTGLILQKRPLMLIRNVRVSLTHWSTRRPMTAKHLFQSPYQSFSMLRSTSSHRPPLRMRWETINYLLNFPSHHKSHLQQGFYSS